MSVLLLFLLDLFLPYVFTIGGLKYMMAWTCFPALWAGEVYRFVLGVHLLSCLFYTLCLRF